MEDNVLELIGIKKHFQDVEVLEGIDLTIKRGEFITLLGASGCGKTTTLRIIAGLESPDEGKVLLEGQDVTDLAPNQRDVNTVFQNYALFPHMNVADNIGYGLRLKKVPKREIREKVSSMLSLVQLEGYEKRRPSELSGGQRQRVAIARALANNPKILLCDEATSALDPTTTKSILALLKEINEQYGITIVIITHEMSVVQEICNQVAIIDNGSLVESGSVEEVFSRPRTKAAQKLVFQGERRTDRMQGRHCIRIVFSENSSFEPVISNMVLACKAPVNILLADTKDIGGIAHGQMVLQLPEDNVTAEKMIQYLKERNLAVEELVDYVE